MEVWVGYGPAAAPRSSVPPARCRQDRGWLQPRGEAARASSCGVLETPGPIPGEAREDLSTSGCWLEAAL